MYYSEREQLYPEGFQVEGGDVSWRLAGLEDLIVEGENNQGESNGFFIGKRRIGFTCTRIRLECMEG